MPTDMLDQLQENKLQGLEEFLDSYQPAGALADEQDQAAAIADSLVDEGIGARQGLLRLWDYYWTMALAGKISDRGERGAKLRSLLGRGGRILCRAAVVARTIADLSGREVARLSQFEEQARAFPLWVQERMACWEMLDRPRKPLNRQRLARSQESYQRGECEDVASILARLEHGGPLVKE